MRVTIRSDRMIVVERFRWIDDTELAVASCVTLATGSARDEVLDAFGARRPLEALSDEDQSSASVGVVKAGDGYVATEINGFQGSRREVISTLARRGRVASAYWNVNAVSALWFGDGEDLIHITDPMTSEGAESQLPASVLDALPELDLRLGPPALLAAIRAFTEVPVTASRVQPQTVYRIDPVPSVPAGAAEGAPRTTGFTGPDFARHAGAKLRDEAVGAALARMTIEQLAQTAIWAARTATGYVGLTDVDVVRDALDAGRTDTVTAPTPELLAYIRTVDAEFHYVRVRGHSGDDRTPEEELIISRHWAARTLVDALSNPATDMGAVEAIEHASMPFRIAGERAEFFRQLHQVIGIR